MNNLKIMEIATDAESKCVHFTMRSAKQHIMIEYSVLTEKERAVFVPCLEATNKKQFLSRILKIINVAQGNYVAEILAL